MSKFTKVLRCQVQCPYCEYQFCLSCLKTYLLVDVVAPRCLNADCRKDWDMVFLGKSLPKTWLRKEWKEHMLKLLSIKAAQSMHTIEPTVAALKEISGPEFKEYDARYREEIKLAKIHNKAVNIERSRLRRLIKSYGGPDSGSAATAAQAEIDGLQYKSVENYCAVAKRQARKIVGKMSMGRRRRRWGGQRAAAPARLLPIDFRTGLERDNVPVAVTEYRIQCPVSGCIGRVGAGKCSECGNAVCGACRELRGVAHECDPVILANVRAISKECRECPTCATPTQKISGCNQMWCPLPCNTWWNYETGQRDADTAFRHNPHFTEWLQVNRQGVCREGEDEVSAWVRGGNVVRLALSDSECALVDLAVGHPLVVADFTSIAKVLFPDTAGAILTFSNFWETIEHCVAQTHVGPPPTNTDISRKSLLQLRLKKANSKVLVRQLCRNYSAVFVYELSLIQGAYAAITKGIIKDFMDHPRPLAELLSRLEMESVRANQFLDELVWSSSVDIGYRFYTMKPEPRTAFRAYTPQYFARRRNGRIMRMQRANTESGLEGRIARLKSYSEAQMSKTQKSIAELEARLEKKKNKASAAAAVITLPEA